MNKIIVVISEWWSEVSFIEEFIKKNYWYKNSNLTKWQKSIEKWEICIFFPYPKQVNWKYWKEWGWDSSILKPETYILVNGLIKQNFSYLLENTQIIYFIQTDINKKEKKAKMVSENLKFCPKWEVFLSFASMEIESWFIVWLWDLFKENHKIDELKLKKICKKNVEKLQDVDYILDEILSPSWYSWAKNAIWREFWKYIDVEQAKKKSPSFKEFVEVIDELLN
jgi:hypothetical protein